MTGTEPSGDKVDGFSDGEWRHGPGDTLVTEIRSMRLVIHPPCAAGYVRFLVMRCPEAPRDRYTLVASGSERSVQAAIRGAERVAARIALSRPSPAARLPGAALEAAPQSLPLEDDLAMISEQPSFPLSGRCVLVVEDEWVIAHDLEQTLRKRGAEVAGPVPSVDKARALLAAGANLDGAVLDVNLGGQMVYPLADVLTQSGVPFVFATGYSAENIPERYAHVPRCYKPINADTVVRVLGSQLPRAEVTFPGRGQARRSPSAQSRPARSPRGTFPPS